MARIFPLMVNGCDIQPLTDATWPDLSALFEQGGDPRWCWCVYWRVRARDFSVASREENRARLRTLIGGDPAPGLVAYRGGLAVGWVS